MCRAYVSFVLTAAILLSFTALAIAQTQTNVRRCYQFTWLGPQYTNVSVNFMNSTCLDATRLASGVPCREPLVVSEDGTWPDVEYIWENHRQEATCIAVNDICAKYTYYFNGYVENSTYLCTRAVDNYEQAITRGCYEQRNGDHVTRACFCTSIEGAMPCNDARVTSTVSIAIIFFAVVAALKGIDVGNLIT